MGVDVEKEASRKTEATDFTDIVGGSGRWQWWVFIVLFITSLPVAWHILAMSFIAPNVGHWCAKPAQYKNLSTEEWKLYGIPKGSAVSGDGYSQCLRYEHINITKGDATNESVPLIINSKMPVVKCDQWEYDQSEFANTVVSQWDLVCDKAWMISMTKSVYMAGVLTSVLVLSQVADKIGRKPVIIGSVVTLLVSGIICAFSMSFIMFTGSRFFVALGAAGIFNTGFVVLLEAVSAESRSFFGIAFEFGWATGFVLLPGIAWLVRDWFWLQMLLTIPCVALLPLWWMVPESPRWLLAQGKTERAKKILTRIAYRNRREVQDMESAVDKMANKSLKEHTEKKKGGNIFDLITTPGLRLRTLNLYFNWFVIAFIYFGLSFNTNDLAGDPFVNFAISGAVEFPAYLLTVLAMKLLGRRIPLMASMVGGGAACLFIMPLTEDLAWVSISLAMFGKFCITMSFAITYVYTAEIFPTVVRNTGVGTSSVCARFGAILSPFVRELSHATHPAVPWACYGILSIASGLCILLLPETKDCKVPDTLEEAAAFGRKIAKKPAPEAPEVQKPCAVHDVLEKPKPPTPKPTSDGKKLPDLLEEPSVVDEGIEDGTRSEEDMQSPNNDPPSDVHEPEVVAEPQESLAEPQESIAEPQQDEAVVAEATEDNAATQQTPL